MNGLVGVPLRTDLIVWPSTKALRPLRDFEAERAYADLITKANPELTALVQHGTRLPSTWGATLAANNAITLMRRAFPDHNVKISGQNNKHGGHVTLQWTDWGNERQFTNEELLSVVGLFSKHANEVDDLEARLRQRGFRRAFGSTDNFSFQKKSPLLEERVQHEARILQQAAREVIPQVTIEGNENKVARTPRRRL